MQFIAIDVETANADMASICQVGIAKFADGQLVEVWSSLIDPEDFFDGINMAIHGIDAKAVKESPKFSALYELLMDHLKGNIVVSHTPFDRTALFRVCEKYKLPEIECTWLDSARVVRRAWPQFSKRGYGLGNVAKQLGVEFSHHNAQEDARAAGEILVLAIRKTGLALQEWLDRVKWPISPAFSSSSSVNMDGNSEGPLYGEVVVFTGALSIPRREAAELAASAGCEIDATVKKTTTVLVVGDQDIRRLAGQGKSSKQRKAEKLIAQGQTIRMLSESDLKKLIELAS